ncbi:hypothetical protein [Deinococcus sp.]|uniref:hypothetical protein n=1 Tax=Deinococcus sp. TaxID=47478 RepID=UPI0025C65748|nr:hypothetical protein [Deinococcus sp.]
MKRLSLALLTLAATALAPVALAAGSDTARTPEEVLAGCNLTPEQDQANAQVAVRSSAKSTLAAAAAMYKSSYSAVSYDLNVGPASINGDSATVRGSITLRATNVATKQPVGGTYSGVVNLTRTGCHWEATGYARG